MDRSAAQRLTLRITGIAGAALFAAFFALTYHTPGWVEDVAAGYIEAQVAERVDSSIDGIAEPQGEDALSRYAAQLMQQNEARIAALKDSLKATARAQMAACIAEIRGLTDEQRVKLQQWLEEGAVVRIGSLQLENSHLAGVIRAGYFGVVADLKRDIRVFTASNSVAFLLLVLVSFLRPGAVRELFVPGVLLAVSTLLCAYLYVFEQNWLLTLINGSYLGWAYGAWLGVVFLLLCDVWINGARISMRIVQVFMDITGSAVSSIS